MKRPHFRRSLPTFVDTPKGIFTDSGIWFQTREAWLRQYAGAVFDHKPVEYFLMQAQIWLRSPQTLTLWLLPVLLFTISPLQASLAALVVYVGWRSLSPSFVSRMILPLVRMLDLVGLQAVYYIVAMTLAARNEQYVVLAVGLGGFILLRWGIIRVATEPVVRRIWSTLYRMPVPDHILRAFIVRAALAHRIKIPDFAPIEAAIVEHLKKK